MLGRVTVLLSLAGAHAFRSSASRLIKPRFASVPSSRVVAPATASLIAPGGEPLPELPTPTLLKAIGDCGSTATAADVAAASGLSVAETRRQLLNLARLVGAELQVAEDGELLFIFDEPGQLKRSLRAESVRQRAKDAWTRVNPPLFWLLRASFGIGLLASLTLVTVAITALTSSKDDRGSSSSANSAMTVGRLWGPSPFDFLYYSTRPYGYYGYGYQSGNAPREKGFLQSCFSLLFGDGDPNSDLARRTSIAAAAVIRANGGAVSAEQLAPILAPNIDPQTADDDASRPGAPISEPWMLPVLLQFNGEPTVTEEGDLIYVFPELMASAGSGGSGAAGMLSPGSAQAALGATAGALALSDGLLTPEEMAQCLVFTERPEAWRPRLGERVVVGALTARRRPEDAAIAQRYVGMEGTLVRDDRDGMPFGVCFDSAALRLAADRGEGMPQPTMYFVTEELLPRGSDASGMSLVELPQRFSTAPTSQLVLAGTLGAANLAGVLYLGAMLSSVAGYPAAALGSSGPLIASLRRIYGPLLAYASAFIAVPSVRALLNRRRNRRIEQRNALRASWGEAVADATSSSPTGGGGLRARLKRKLEAARKLRPRLRRLSAGDASAGMGFSTSRGIEERDVKGGNLAGDGFDDFDARLNAAKPERPPE